MNENDNDKELFVWKKSKKIMCCFCKKLYTAQGVGIEFYQLPYIREYKCAKCVKPAGEIIGMFKIFCFFVY